jgi:hypothetical protein
MLYSPSIHDREHYALSTLQSPLARLHPGMKCPLVWDAMAVIRRPRLKTQSLSVQVRSAVAEVEAAG